MNKDITIKKFNEKYDLTDINTKWFVETTKEEFDNSKSDSISGKPRKIWMDVLKRFFTNKWNIIFSLILLILIIFVVFGSSMTSFSANKPVSTSSTSHIAYLKPSFSNGQNSTLNNVSILQIEKAIGIVGIKAVPSGSTFVFEDSQHNVLSNVKYVSWSSKLGFSVKLINPYFIGTTLGTDAQGFDVWTKLWTSSAWSFKLAFVVAIIETIIGVSIGIYLGFNIGKAPDTILLRIIEVFSSIPSLLWVSILALIFGTSFWSLAIALIFIGWIGPVYSSRMYTIKVKDSEFIHASKSIGTGTAGILFKHILPNIIGRLTVGFVHRIPAVIFTETTLVFLGFTIGGDTANTLGNFIQQARLLEAIDANPYFLVSGAMVLILFTLSMQIISNGIRDAFDPRIGGK